MSVGNIAKAVVTIVTLTGCEPASPPAPSFPADSILAVAVVGPRAIVQNDSGTFRAILVVLVGATGRPESVAVHADSVRWSGSDARIAYVRPAGTVLGRRPGDLLVTATIGDRVTTDSVRITPTQVAAAPLSLPLVLWHGERHWLGRPFAADAAGRHILDQDVRITSRDSGVIAVETTDDGIVALVAVSVGWTWLDVVAGTYRDSIVMASADGDAWIVSVNEQSFATTGPLVVSGDNLRIRYLLRVPPGAFPPVFVNFSTSRLRSLQGSTQQLVSPDVQSGTTSEHEFHITGRVVDSTALWLRSSYWYGATPSTSQPVQLASTVPFPAIEIQAINGQPVAQVGRTPVADRFTVTMQLTVPAQAPLPSVVLLGADIDADSALGVPFSIENLIGGRVLAPDEQGPGMHTMTWTAHQAPAGEYRLRAAVVTAYGSAWVQAVDVAVTNADETAPTFVATPGDMVVVNTDDPLITFDITDLESGVHALTLIMPTLGCGYLRSRISLFDPEPVRAARIEYRPSQCLGRRLTAGPNPFYVTVTDNAWQHATDTITIVYDPTASTTVASAPRVMPAGTILLDTTWLRARPQVLVETVDLWARPRRH
jgi:hypothetical protein